MSRLDEQARALRDATVELVKKYQFRDRNETVAHGLSVSQTYALGTIARQGPLAMTDVAEDLRLTASTMSRVVDQLVRKGLVVREQSARDRRVWRVAATTSGRSLWRRIDDSLRAIDREVLASVAPAERPGMIRAVRLLSAATDRWRRDVASREGS
jgi:DNA-binding MarR family transcriptional regulator